MKVLLGKKNEIPLNGKWSFNRFFQLFLIFVDHLRSSNIIFIFK